MSVQLQSSKVLVGFIVSTIALVAGCQPVALEVEGSLGARAEGLSEAELAGAAGSAPSAAVCGDGELAPTEECDSALEGFSDVCDASCKRVPYRACITHEECGEQNAACASVRSTAGSYFCASFCRDAASCPTVPGYTAACNFAWCALLCNDGVCPNGMDCERGFPAVDSQGVAHGTHDLCVIATSATPGDTDAGVEP